MVFLVDITNDFTLLCKWVKTTYCVLLMITPFHQRRMCLAEFHKVRFCDQDFIAVVCSVDNIESRCLSGTNLEHVADNCKHYSSAIGNDISTELQTSQ